MRKVKELAPGRDSLRRSRGVGVEREWRGRVSQYFLALLSLSSFSCVGALLVEYLYKRKGG